MMLLALLSLFLLTYTIAAYPALQSLLARFRPSPVNKGGFTPPLSAVICVRDEEKQIVRRIRNLLGMDYPADLIEVVIVSDGSTDDTEKMVADFGDPRVKLIALDEQRGKASALNAGIGSASHDFLLLGDARQTFSPNTARDLMAHFNDPGVGAVSGRLDIRPESGQGAASGIGSSYWSYEVQLRTAEAASDSVIGVSGAIYALRKACFSPIPEGTILDDVLIPMRTVLQGYRVTFESAAVAEDTKAVEDKGELTRKVRTLYGNLQLMRLCPDAFLPWRNRLWCRFISHKILRLFLPAMFGGSLLFSLLAGGLFTLFGLFQAICWGMAIHFWRTGNDSKAGRALSALVLLNLAAIKAWSAFLTGNAEVWSAASSNLTPGRGEDA